ncbi:MAG: hypothetical protein F6J95_017385 [Leptolyngbya sp. SIO1E4]|nr:hypothetical protein [Leptolyngbya sp. SIO1E4]
MSRSSLLRQLAICKRFTFLVLVWTVMLLGIYEAHESAENQGGGNPELRRLAVYGILIRANR